MAPRSNQGMGHVQWIWVELWALPWPSHWLTGYPSPSPVGWGFSCYPEREGMGSM